MSFVKNYNQNKIDALLKKHNEIYVLAHMTMKRIAKSAYSKEYHRGCIVGGTTMEWTSGLVRAIDQWRSWNPWACYREDSPYNNRTAQICILIINSATNEIAELRSGRDSSVDMERVYRAIKKLSKD